MAQLSSGMKQLDELLHATAELRRLCLVVVRHVQRLGVRFGRRLLFAPANIARAHLLSGHTRSFSAGRRAPIIACAGLNADTRHTAEVAVIGHRHYKALVLVDTSSP